MRKVYDEPMIERLYQKLIVWKEGDALCLFTYKVTKDFPSEEKFALVQQMRRSSYGVPMCIVEGSARKTPKDRKHFMVMAIGSLEELHYQFSLALRLGYMQSPVYDVADDHIKRVSFLLRKLHVAIN